MDLTSDRRSIVADVMADWLREAKAGETMSVILRVPGLDAHFEKVQDRAADLMPDLRDFETEFHVTLAYASGLSMDSIDAAVPEVVEAIRDKSFTLTIGPVTSLVNQKGECVLYLAVNDQGLTDLHFAIRTVLSLGGGVYTFPVFKGHVTMAYRGTPIDEASVSDLNAITPMVSVACGSKDFKVTRKNGDAWERLA